MKPTLGVRMAAYATAAAVFLVACSSSTVIRSNPPGARVFLDDQPVGVTPYAMSDTKIVGTSTRVRLEYPGMRPHFAVITRNEKFDVLACIGGVLVLVPFLWIMGYNDDHYFDMTMGQPIQAGYTPAAPPPGNPPPGPGGGGAGGGGGGGATPDPVPAKQGDAARADQLNEEGKTLYKNRDYQTAAGKFRQAIQLSPEARFYYNLCAALDLGGDANGALAACTDVYSHGPSPELKAKTDDRVKQIRAKKK